MLKGLAISSRVVGFAFVALTFGASACGPGANGGPADNGGSGAIGGSGGSGTGGSSASGGADAGAGGSFGSGGSVGTGSKCSFTFDVTTQDDRGNYAPRNVEAAWIMGPNNQFVRTLELHGSFREIHLVKWEAASSGNTVDAVTSATLYSQPQSHHDTWDCTDVNGNPVPNGTYNVYVEFTEDDTAYGFGSSQVTHVSFQVGNPQNISPPNQQYFTSMHLVLN